MRAFHLRLAAFGGLLALGYLLLLAGAANAPVGVRRWLARHTNIPAGRPEPGRSSLLRMAELARTGRVDVLFVGSSHCFRTFDVRRYQALGLRAFNMGSTSQTPLNSHYLLRRHLARLRPRLVVFEVFWRPTQVESTLDLSANMDPAPELLRMALATRELQAVNGVLLAWLERGRVPRAELRPRLRPENRYLPGGSVIRAIEDDPPPERRPVPTWWDEPVRWSPRLLDYLAANIRLATEHGARVALVLQPIARPLDALDGGPAYRARLVRLGAPFIDGNASGLTEPRYFYDSHHLTERAAVAFNTFVLDQLRARRLLPAAAR